MSESAGASPVQKAKRTSVGARASTGGVQTKRVRSSPELPGVSVPTETAARSPDPALRTVISACAGITAGSSGRWIWQVGELPITD